MRNPITWRQRLRRLRGTPIDLDLSPFLHELSAMNRLEREVHDLSDDALDKQARELRRTIGGGRPLTHARVPLFALAREAAHRALGLRPFDEQVVAGLALDRGAVVQMQTGEGKTLAAVMPAALNALTGRGVHVLTFNGYLAERDAAWMGPVYTRLGLTVGAVRDGMSRAERRRAYGADVTYVTAKEAGFDYLRDLLATDVADLVHRPFHLAIVDEADSILIDEGRVPLVIAGRVERERPPVEHLTAIVDALEPGSHFDTDEYGRDVELTVEGYEHIERLLECGKLQHEKNYQLLAELHCALHARVLLRRDVDYIVRDGRIALIDDFTGRVVPDRHWPDGLQAAVEAKEGLRRQSDGTILGSVTLQHFLRGYPRLAGMTGTAEHAADELAETYGLRVVIVPTHRPMIRVDHPDAVFTHRDAKETALIEEIRRTHLTGRPVLVGTLSVDESERIASRLAGAGIACQVLNARNDHAEASIVANAGRLGTVTIATNMAGRGTDIRLGGDDAHGRDEVAALGGLYVIGTNRHESRRVDLQLRGRAGRQGDPGESRIFLSLDDDLLIKYGIRTLIPAGALPEPQPEPIEDAVLRREIARAQRIMEGQNLEIRRTLLRYATVVERQRRLVVDRRTALLLERQAPDLWTRAPERRAALAGRWGEAAVMTAERVLTIAALDGAWREHLAIIADLREGIHLVALGGLEPLAHFTSEAIAAFARLEASVEDTVLQALERLASDTEAEGQAHDGVGKPLAQRAGLDLKGPSSTWTYLVTDDPFRNHIGMLLTGPGRTTIAIYAASLTWPLLLLWGIVDRWWRRGTARRASPFGSGTDDPVRRPHTRQSTDTSRE